MSMKNTAALALLCAVLVSGCKEREVRYQPAEAPKPSEAELILKSYDVPAAQAQQVKSVLGSVFRGLKEKSLAARAELSPDGQLLIVGPHGVHRGVAELIQKMADRKPPPAPPSVEMHYWLVVASPADKPSFAPGLDAVRPALDAFIASQGPMRFHKLESLRLRSLGDEHAEANGVFASVHQRVSVGADKVIADVQIRGVSGARLETRLALEPDKYLMLGEAGIRMSDFKHDLMAGEGPHTLIYIVRAVVHGNG